MRLPIGLHAATALAVTAMALLQGFTPAPAADADLVAVDVAAVLYRESGEFLRGGTPANGPLVTLRSERPIEIMRRQVTRGEYDACVADGACAALDGTGDPALPVVGVNFDDAVAYAAWKSDVTGESWRLPTDREWALAAGSRYRDDAYTEVSDPANPARRWIAVYDAESAGKEAIDPDPRPVGSFGANEHGLVDLSGNVWEWTSTCYVRYAEDPRTGAVATSENCGVRIAEGRHRAYMTGFFRDPKAGACSVGVPPANLGIRLVRESTGLVDGMARWLGF